MRSGLDKMSNLAQRVIVGLIGVAVIITAIVFSEWTYFIIFATIAFFTILEFYKLIGLDGLFPLKSWGTMVAMLLFAVSFLTELNLIPVKVYYGIIPLAACIFFIKLYKKGELKPFTNIAYTFLGLIYIGVPFALLNLVAFCMGEYRYEIILGLLLLIWACDTGAYFAGTLFGRTKLFERISPKKTWEGFLGGAALSMLIAIILSYYFEILPIWKWVVIALITLIAGTYGDLVESLFKRSILIKDSGRSLPGHGGFLDRFDGLILAIPFIIAFLKLT